MINLDLGATYDGYDVTATFEIVKELQQLGMTDEEINKILERAKDSEKEGGKERGVATRQRT
jgi:DNA-binding transcriptional MerR regulator